MKQHITTAIDKNIHPVMMDETSIFYMLNGDVSGKEGSTDWFAQNTLSTSLCYSFSTNYKVVGKIQLNKFEYVLFFVIYQPNTTIKISSEIGILNTDECNYTVKINAACLNFDPDYPVRGVYKHNSDTTKRRIYFIDGLNFNRFLDIDADVFPTTLIDGECDCVKQYSNDFDCEKIKINRNLKIPEVSMSYNQNGNLNSGTYQLAISFGDDDLPLTEYYLGPVLKLFSITSNGNINVELKCVGEQLYSQMFIALVTNTRGSSQVVYDLGIFSNSTQILTISNLSNTTINTINNILQKSVTYDISEHIATNQEILLLGKHQTKPLLEYQLLANNIELKWATLKVNASDAHKYPTFLRDEVYAFAIEWFDKQGKSRGIFHIPGRSPEYIEVTGVETPSTNDFVNYFETDNAPPEYNFLGAKNCTNTPLKIFETTNTAKVTYYNDSSITCTECTLDLTNVYQKGKMAYWESKDYTYPNDDRWGNLKCLPIRHHKMPDHGKAHIYGSLDPSRLWNINVTTTGCINLLTIETCNVEHPKLENGTYDPDISGYRILYSDRINTFNKSILHKGLLVGGRIQEQLNDDDNEQTAISKPIIYPNYPYNDMHREVFLSRKQTLKFDVNKTNGGPTDFIPAFKNSYVDHFYYSPETQYRETRNEIGIYITKYCEDIGSIQGEISPTYLHPQLALGHNGQPLEKGLSTYAFQSNSISDSVRSYNKFSTAVFLNTPPNQAVTNRAGFYENYLLEKNQFILPIKQKVVLDEKGNYINLNNLLRDYCYYFQLNKDLINKQDDVSRVLASDIVPTPIQSISKSDTRYYYDSSYVLSKENWRPNAPSGQTPKNIQSVFSYVGVKIYFPNQYGELSDIVYKPLQSAVIKVPGLTEEMPSTITYSNDLHIGGDIYISKHSFIRKMPLFQEWLYDVPFDTEYNYRVKRNVEYPRFWYDNLSVVNDEVRFDHMFNLATGSNTFYFLGKFYTSVNGVVNYYGESEFIGDFREFDSDPNGLFYPLASPEELFRSDIYRYPEKFLYNLSLLNTNVENKKQDIFPTITKEDYTVIYSLKDDEQSAGDRWLQFLPLNYTILPRVYGDFTGIHYTDTYNIMFIFENQILYSQMDYRLQSTEGNSILITQGDIFSQRLVKLTNETTGYCGSLDPFSFVNTRYGTYFVDRLRKKVFKWAGKLEDVSYSFSSWLNSYMVNDNPGYTNSIIAVFDNFSDNLFFTYKNLRTSTDWTLSYKPRFEHKQKPWISFHSFIPSFYLSLPNTFISINNTNVWKHNSLYSYQQIYGNQVKFDIGFIISNPSSEYQALEIYSEWIKYETYNSEVYNNKIFFDKLFAYTQNGSTGLIPIVLKNKNNPIESFAQNSEQGNYLAEATHVTDGIYRINKLVSYKDNLNVASSLTNGDTYTAQGINQNLPPLHRDDLKGKWLKLHLIKEINSDYKILLQFTNSQTLPICI